MNLNLKMSEEKQLKALEITQQKMQKIMRKHQNYMIWLEEKL